MTPRLQIFWGWVQKKVRKLMLEVIILTVFVILLVTLGLEVLAARWRKWR